MDGKMIGNWPTEVPRDYKALHTGYGDFIAYVCQRYGRADQSPADLLQHIWEKLINAKVLEKYVASLQTNCTVPDTVSTLEACALLGVSFGAWRSAQWSYLKIFKDVLGGHAPVGGRDRGVTTIRGLMTRCTKCKGKGHPETDAHPVPCTKCKGSGVDKVRAERWVLWMPEVVDPKMGGPASAKARFHTKQVIALAEMNIFKNVCVNLPTATASVAHFKNYLRQCIKNHFANWVRTKKRRHKERPSDCFVEFHGHTADGFEGDVLEVRIGDPMATNRMEAMAEIGKILGRAQTSELLARREDLISLLDDGYSLIEAVKKLDLSKETCRAVQKAIKTVA